MRAEVITSWIGDGLTPETAQRPRIGDDYPELYRVQDTTGQSSENLYPKPNMYIVLIVCTPEVLQEIEDDPLYYVNWSEE